MNGPNGLLLGLIVLVSVSAFAYSSRASLSQIHQPNALSFKAALMRVVPVGTTVAEAKSKMESYGFKCNMVLNKSYSDYSSPDGRQVVYPPADFLSCVSARTVKFIIEKTWLAALVVVEDKVTAIATNVYLTGM
jgi:hypothetical protein